MDPLLRRAASPGESPDTNAALDSGASSPLGPSMLTTPQYAALMAPDEDEDLSTRLAKEAIATAYCPKSQVPLQLHGAAGAPQETPAVAKEALARQALYAPVGERVYPRTNPNVTSFGVFDIPPAGLGVLEGDAPSSLLPISNAYGANYKNSINDRYGGGTKGGGRGERSYNSLDEADRQQTCQQWWTESADRAADRDLCPRMPIPPEVVPIPPLGFPKPFNDSAYRWNSRYLSVLYSPDGREREEAAALFVREFTDEAVPILNFVLSNLTSLPSPLLHCRGITIEVLGKAPYLEALFRGDHVASYKAANREYNARIAAHKAHLPQLVTPYTIMVELYGAKAIAYPRVPLNPRPQGPCASTGDGLAYGVRTDLRQFHSEYVVANSDTEAESVARRLAKGLNAKPKYLGREPSELQVLYAPSTFGIYRSPHDNRLYSGALMHMFAPSAHAELAACNEYFINTFRPEFAEKHQAEPLSFESCTHLQVVGRSTDETSRADALNLLLRYVVPQAAQQFSRDVRLWGVSWALLERGGLSRFMHSWGVNMRYLLEFRNGIRVGAKHNVARAFVEVEMVGRALKRSILKQCNLFAKDGIAYPHEISGHLKRLATGTVGSLWESEVWPAVVARYPAVAEEQWSSSRLDWKRCVERLLALIGAQVRTSKPLDPQVPPTSRVVYTPIVSAPPFPPAPYGEGEVMQLTLRARRFLRSAVIGNVTDAARQQAFICVQFLQNGPEAACEELSMYVASETRRKEKLRAKAAGDREEKRTNAKAHQSNAQRLLLGSYGHFIAMRDREGKLIFDPSPEAMGPFGFLTQQRLQITLGPCKGRRTQVIGARGGHMWRADAGADQPVECTGRNHMELMIHYGFIAVDHDEGGMIDDPLLLPGEGTLLIYEQSRSVVEGQFGYATGQQLLLKAPGPYQGQVTTVVGVRQGALYHFPAGTVGYPVPFSPGEDDEAFSLGSIVLASYPIESSALDSFITAHVGDYYIGLKVTLPFGYHYRQVVYFTKGPYEGHTACIMGAGRGELWAVLDYGETLALGDIKAAIDALHGPVVRGLISEEWATTHYRTNTTFYPTVGGEPVVLNTSDAAVLEVADLLPGTRIMVTGGYRCGEVAAVVGARKGRVWIQFEGETGGTPLSTDAYIVIREVGSGATVDADVFAADGVHFSSLSPCGSVLPISLSVNAAFPFGLYHGQQIAIERFDDHEGRYLGRLEGEARVRAGGVLPPEETLFRFGARGAGPARAVVIGTYRHQLWVQREGCAYVLPLSGYNSWELRHHHGAIRVVGVAPVAPWSDGFMYVGDMPAMAWTSFDRQYRAEGIVVFALKTGEPIGLVMTEEKVRPFRPNGVLRQRKVSNFCEDAVAQSPSLSAHTPYIQVVGGWDGITYIADYVLSDGFTIVDAKAVVRPLLDGHVFEEVPAEELHQLWLAQQYGIAVEDMKEGSSKLAAILAATPRIVEPFLKQIGVASAPSRNASVGECFALVDAKGSIVQAVPQEVVARATSFESPEVLIYTDQGAYNFEAMSYRQFIVDFHPLALAPHPAPTPSRLSNARRTSLLAGNRRGSSAMSPLAGRRDTNASTASASGAGTGDAHNHSHTVREETYRIVRRSVYTAESVLSGLFGILPAWGSPLVETVEGIAISLTKADNDGNRQYAGSILGIKDSRCYFDEDLALWKDTVAECVSELLILDLVAEGVGLPDSLVAEFMGMHQYFSPLGLHGCCAYVLSMVGCEEEVLLHHYSLDQCVRMVLVVVRRATANPLGVTLTAEEYHGHLRRRLAVVESDEAKGRRLVDHQHTVAMARLLSNPRMANYGSAFAASFEADVLDEGHASMAEAGGDIERWIAGDDPLERSTAADNVSRATDGTARPGRRRTRFTLTSGGIAGGDDLAEPWGRIARTRAEIDALYPAPPPLMSTVAGGGGRASAAGSSLNTSVATGNNATKQVGRGSVARREGGSIWGSLVPDQNALRIQLEGFRFTQDDGSIFHLMPTTSSFAAFRRGDVVAYTIGDLKGTMATILGVRNGELWRCEHSGPFEGRGIPFEGSMGAIMSRFGAEVVPPDVCAERGIVPNLLCGNPSTFLTWSGELKAFDVSHESCFLRYGVVVGQRFQSTRHTPDYFPYKGFVIVVVGVLGDRLWFMCDGTGAMPFPLEMPNPIYSFRLRLLYSAPIHPPALTGDGFVRVQGSLTELERRFFRDPGAQSMVFDISPSLLGGFQEGLVHGLRTMAVDGASGGKARRAIIVGARHGKVWAVMEYDSFATALSSRVTFELPPPDEPLARVSCIPFARVPEVTTRRYPVPQGGLGVFATDGTVIQYGLRSGEVIEWGADARRTRSTVLGLRNNCLWRVDDGEAMARPFQGRASIVSLQELMVERLGDDAEVVRLRPW